MPSYALIALATLLLAAALVGGITGAVVSLHINNGRVIESAKHRSVITRFIKVVGFNILGLILVYGVSFALQYLKQSTFDPVTSSLLGTVVGGVAAAIHKSINWKDAGIEDPTQTITAIATQQGQTVALPTYTVTAQDPAPVPVPDPVPASVDQPPVVIDTTVVPVVDSAPSVDASTQPSNLGE